MVWPSRSTFRQTPQGTNNKGVVVMELFVLYNTSRKLAIV